MKKIILCFNTIKDYGGYYAICFEKVHMIKEFLKSSKINYDSLEFKSVIIDEQEFDYLCLCFPNINFDFYMENELNEKIYIIK